MGTKGTVSLWVGTAASKDCLDRVLDVAFSEDGDFLGSSFSTAFDVGYYDQAQQEAEYRVQPHGDLAVLLGRVSYARIVVPRFCAIVSDALDVEANCFVLIYDYHHAGKQFWSSPNVTFRFVGSVAYEGT